MFFVNKAAAALHGLADKLTHHDPPTPAPPETVSEADTAQAQRFDDAVQALSVTPLPPPSAPSPAPPIEVSPMSTTAVVPSVKAGFSIKTPGHALATGLHDFYTGIKAVENVIAKIDTPANQALVESLSSLVPQYGPQAVTVERGLFAVGGEVAAILGNLSDGGEQKLLNAGFDASVIADFKALIASVPGLVKPVAVKAG